MTKPIRNDVRVFLLPTTVQQVRGPIFFLFSQNQIVEILGQKPICQLPFTSAHASGVVEYFGQLLPVISLDTLLGGRAKPGPFKQLIVVRTGVIDPVTGANLKVALTSRTRLRMARLDSRVLQSAFTQAAPPKTLAGKSLLRGYFERGSNRVALLNLSALASPASQRGARS
jgi:chemotaxis signal transduction protein